MEKKEKEKGRKNEEEVNNEKNWRKKTKKIGIDEEITDWKKRRKNGRKQGGKRKERKKN